MVHLVESESAAVSADKCTNPCRAARKIGRVDMNEVIHVHATRQIGIAEIHIEEQLVYNAIVNKVENLYKTTPSIRSIHNFPNTPTFTIKHRLVHNKHVNVQIRNTNIPYLQVEDTSNNHSDFT